MRKRLEFYAWGVPKHIKLPQYAVDTGVGRNRGDVVAWAIAGKNGLDVLTLRPDGHQTNGEKIDADIYEATLGHAGYQGRVWVKTPTATVRFAVIRCA